MSDAPAADAPKAAKKGGMVKKLVMFGILPLVLVGGGAGAGLYAAKGLGGGGAAHEKKEDPNRPKLMLKSEGGHSESGGEGEGKSEDGVSGGGGTPAEGPEPANPDPGMYQATYYAMEQPFTSNLADTDGFLQVGIGMSTYYDKRVISNLKAAEMPVRSMILQVLSSQSAEALNTPQGKDKLRHDLRDAINKTLKEHEGFGGVEDVYFTSFIVQ